MNPHPVQCAVDAQCMSDRILASAYREESHVYEMHIEGVHRQTLTTFRLLFLDTPGPGGEWVVKFYVTPASGSPFTPTRTACGDTSRSSEAEALVFFTRADRERWWRILFDHANIIWTDLPVTNQPIGAEE